MRETGTHVGPDLDLYTPRDSDSFTTHLVTALSRLVSTDLHSYNEVNGPLTIIRPHIQQALANAQLLTRLESQSAALHRIMADLSMSVLTLTPHNTVLWGMPRALTILSQLHGWNANQPNQLPPVILNWILKLEHEFHLELV